MSGRDSFPPSEPDRDQFDSSRPSAQDLTADEWLLEALGTGDRPGEAGDRVADLLADWRDDLRPETASIPPLLRAAIDERFLAEPAADQAPPPVDDAPAGVATLVRPPQARRRFTMALAGTGMMVAMVGGVMVAAADAGPDSVLWPVAQAVYGEDAGASKVGSEVDELLNRAENASAEGDLDAAMAFIDQAEATASELAAGDARDDLLDRCDDAREQAIQSVDGTTGGDGTENGNGHAAGEPGSSGSGSPTDHDDAGSPPGQTPTVTPPSNSGSPSDNGQGPGGNGNGGDNGEGGGNGDGAGGNGDGGNGDGSGASEDPPDTGAPTEPTSSRSPSAPGASPSASGTGNSATSSPGGDHDTGASPGNGTGSPNADK